MSLMLEWSFGRLRAVRAPWAVLAQQIVDLDCSADSGGHQQNGQPAEHDDLRDRHRKHAIAAAAAAHSQTMMLVARSAIWRSVASRASRSGVVSNIVISSGWMSHNCATVDFP